MLDRYTTGPFFLIKDSDAVRSSSLSQVESIRGSNWCQGGFSSRLNDTGMFPDHTCCAWFIDLVLLMLVCLWYNDVKITGDGEMAARKKEAIKTADKRLQDYELVYIVRPEVTDESLESRIEGISQFITGRDGVVSDVERWGKKKLSYPVGHSLEGNYVLTRFKMNPARCRELEANLEISEEILRHLLIKLST